MPRSFVRVAPSVFREFLDYTMIHERALFYIDLNVYEIDIISSCTVLHVVLVHTS